jgi:transposase
MRLIDADRLLTDRMKSKYYHLPNGDIAIPLIDIEHAPTIEPERKTGWWIIKETTYEDTEAKCSCCGFETLVDQPGNGLHMVNDLHYCPHCGADMRGDQDDPA